MPQCPNRFAPTSYSYALADVPVPGDCAAEANLVEAFCPRRSHRATSRDPQDTDLVYVPHVRYVGSPATAGTPAQAPCFS
ncbi:hypothetical protein DIPPA_01394 [Diplonema papillatum]|nr:hypothetical protein DIPPA_01394 [Diplonema papillatum]